MAKSPSTGPAGADEARALRVFEGALAGPGLILRGRTLVAGVSGGADSLCLLRWLSLLRGRLGFSLVTVHVNHGLRGSRSDADEALVLKVCAGLKVPCRVFRPRLAAGAGLEERARNARRRCFRAACRGLRSPLICLGHHMDDQAETLLLNLARGAGLEGGSGLKPLSRLEGSPPLPVLRPLLGLRKSELRGFLRQAGWRWREDASNRDTRLSRNFIRRRVLPLLEKVNPGTVRHLAAFSEKCREAREEIGYRVARRRGGQAGVAGQGSLLHRLETWRGLSAPLLRHALRGTVAGLAGLEKGLDEAATRRLARLVSQGRGACDLARGWRAWAGRGMLLFHREGARPPAPRRLAGGTLDLPFWCLRLRSGLAAPPSPFAPGEGVFWFDAAVLKSGIWVRPFKPGERIRPFGMGGSKPVSDLLAEAAVPPPCRAGWPVLSRGKSGEVLAVLGLRRSGFAPVDGRTRRAWRVAWEATPGAGGPSGLIFRRLIDKG